MSVPNQDRYKKFTAVVNGGSGVIFQPITDEYSYILTAKHTLYEDEEMKKPIQSHKLSVKNTDINFIEKYEHDDLDIAILKIKKVNIETPSKWIKDIEEKKYDFWGHPDYNRKNNAKDSLDNFKLTANKTESNKTIVVFDNLEFSDKKVIDGFSGGGIFTEVNDLICLIAIEFEMNALPTDRRDRRLKAVSIKAFDEIIDKNNLASLGECKLKQEKEDKPYLSKTISKSKNSNQIEVNNSSITITNNHYGGIVIGIMLMAIAGIIMFYTKNQDNLKDKSEVNNYAKKEINKTKNSLSGEVRNRKENQIYYLYMKGNTDIKTTSKLNGSFVFEDIFSKDGISDTIPVVCCTDKNLEFCRKPFKCVKREKCEIP